MKVYLAGPMRGIPFFNFPAFNEAAAKLREQGHTVFNPAQRDTEMHGEQLSQSNPTGDEVLAANHHGFSLREALRDDTNFICMEADAIALLPGWEKSKGARAEKALAQALGLKVMYLAKRKPHGPRKSKEENAITRNDTDNSSSTSNS